MCSTQRYPTCWDDECELVRGDNLLHSGGRGELDDRGFCSLVGKGLGEEVGDLAGGESGYRDGLAGCAFGGDR